LLPAHRLDLPMLRLRFRPELLSGDGAARAAWDAALPADRSRVVLLGADTPVAIAWAWQRGITHFTGRVLDARHLERDDRRRRRSDPAVGKARP
jgi:hypothetical protein